MNCPKCNAQNDDNAEICMICGEPLDTEETLIEDKNAMLEEIQLRRLKKKKSKRRKKIILICIILALILGAGGYGVYNFVNDTDANNTVVIPTRTPSVSPTEAIPESTPEITQEPEVTVAPDEIVTPEAELAPEVTPDAVAPVTTKKPVVTIRPQKPAVQETKPSPAPVISSPGFVAGSIAQASVPQGSPIVSTLVLVQSTETPSYSGQSIARFTIGNETYYAYAANFDKGVPGMYSIDATATADVYNGLPVYSITKLESYDINGYILPQSTEKLLTEADLAELSKAQLDLARNEIFARHGRVFKRREIQTYFETKAWYKKNASYNYTNDYANLSDTELANAKFILAYENK